MSNNNSKQAVCKNCDAVGIYHPISWDNAARANLQTKKPLNMDGTIHNCPNYKPQQQNQGFKGQPNPSGYNPQSISAVQPLPQQQHQPQPQLQQQQTLGEQDNLYTIMEEIIAIKQRQEEMYRLMYDWITYNPVAATLSTFITDMIRGREDKLPGPRSAEEIKDSMSNVDIDPFEDNGSRENQI